MNYEILANAIVEQAAKDYRGARTALGKDTENVASFSRASRSSSSFDP